MPPRSLSWHWVQCKPSNPTGSDGLVLLLPNGIESKKQILMHPFRFLVSGHEPLIVRAIHREAQVDEIVSCPVEAPLGLVPVLDPPEKVDDDCESIAIEVSASSEFFKP